VLGHVEGRPGVEARFSFLLRRDIPPPDHLAGLGAPRLEVRGHVQVVAARPENQLVLDHHRGDRAVVHHLERTELLGPLFRAGLEIERDEVAVGGHEVDRAAEHRHAAVADLDAAAAAGEVVVPQLAGGSRIDGVDVVRRGEVQHAANLQRRRLDRSAAGQVVDPGQAQVLDVGRGDLRQAAEAPA
jgi:hypothetical protein